MGLRGYKKLDKSKIIPTNKYKKMPKQKSHFTQKDKK